VTAPASLSATGWNMQTGFGNDYSAGEYSCRVNSSGQISHAATSGTAYRIWVMGWRDRRGRDK
jgi:hypothetical protein